MLHLFCTFPFRLILPISIHDLTMDVIQVQHLIKINQSGRLCLTFFFLRKQFNKICFCVIDLTRKVGQLILAAYSTVFLLSICSINNCLRKRENTPALQRSISIIYSIQTSTVLLQNATPYLNTFSMPCLRSSVS